LPIFDFRFAIEVQDAAPVFQSQIGNRKSQMVNERTG